MASPFKKKILPVKNTQMGGTVSKSLALYSYDMNPGSKMVIRPSISESFQDSCKHKILICNERQKLDTKKRTLFRRLFIKSFYVMLIFTFTCLYHVLYIIFVCQSFPVIYWTEWHQSSL